MKGGTVRAAIVRPADALPTFNWSPALVVLLILALAWQIVDVMAAGYSRNLMFDGAMNLETARSIAEGEGPRRMYDSKDMFPPGVQTKEPYVLLGALVFKAFGVGPLQAQLPNMIYFLLLVGAIVFVVRNAFGNLAALAAAVLALATPTMTQYALNGYGEIPMFFFGFVSLAIVAWPAQLQPRLIRRCLWAGVFSGLAIATKVIGVALVIAVTGLLLLRLWFEAQNRFRATVEAAVAMAAGIVVPLLMVEVWRWLWLDAQGYVDWWKHQVHSILFQSGAASTSPDSIPVYAKITQHFGILARDLTLSKPVLLGMLLVPLVGMALAFDRGFTEKQRMRGRWLILGLVLIVALYFPWWLAMVPTEKAWLRYLYVAVMTLAVLAAISVVGNVRAASRPGNMGMRAMHSAVALAVIALYSPFLWQSLHRAPSFDRSIDMQATLHAAELVSDLDPETMVLGYGWYAAPTIQLYSDRGFEDLTDWPIGRLTDKPGYLVADRATLMTGMLNSTLSRYPHRRLMRANPFAQVYSVDFSSPNDPFRVPGNTLSSVEFSTVDYVPTYGMEPFDPMGGRWVSSDSEILLRYENQPALRISGYMALPHFYRRPEPLSGRVVIGSCPPIPLAFTSSGWAEFHLPLQCRPIPGDTRVRILWDNVFDLPLVYDRQRAMLLGAIGFTN